MESESKTYEKGELVPARGTYRCTGSGEIWVATEDRIRFPPCEVCKDGGCRWVHVPTHGHHGH